MPTNKETFEAKMNALANAINSKAGTSGSKDLDELKTAVDSISTGIDTSDATATAADIMSGKTAYVNNVKVTGTASGAEPDPVYNVILTMQVEEVE